MPNGFAPLVAFADRAAAFMSRNAPALILAAFIGGYFLRAVIGG